MDDKYFNEIIRRLKFCEFQIRVSILDYNYYLFLYKIICTVMRRGILPQIIVYKFDWYLISSNKMYQLIL